MNACCSLAIVAYFRAIYYRMTAQTYNMCIILNLEPNHVKAFRPVCLLMGIAVTVLPEKLHCHRLAL